MLFGVSTFVLAGLALFLLDAGARGEQLVDLLLEAGPLRWHLGLDGVSAPVVLLVAGATLTAIFVAPRGADAGRIIATLLLVESATVLALVALDGTLLIAGWALGHVAVVRRLRHHGAPRADLSTPRIFALYQGFGTLCLAAAVAISGGLAWRAGAAHPFDLSVESTSLGGSSDAVVVLVLLAGLTRMGAFPLHSWLPRLLERGPLGVAMVIATAPLGLHLLGPVALRLSPGVATRDIALLWMPGLASVAYGSLLALTSNDLRRTVGYVAMTQSGLCLMGLAAGDATSVEGALLESLVSGVALIGLIVVIWSVSNRLGSADICRFGGLARHMPRAAGAYFLFALALTGLPGTPTFVAEDLLLQGVLHDHPIAAGLMLLGTVLSAFALVRAGFRAFLGPARGEEVPADLLPRERLSVIGVALVVAFLGLIPGPLLRARQSATEALVAQSSDLLHPGHE